MIGSQDPPASPQVLKPHAPWVLPRWVWLAAGVLLAGNAAIAIYKAWPILFPEVAQAAALDPDCDLRSGPCVSEMSDGRGLEFAITPRSIPLLQPLALRVTLQGIEAQKVEVDFAGVSMNMGYNRVRLTALGDGVFAGEARLPVCVRGRMAWEARVLAATDDGLLSAPYRFETRR